MISFERFVRVAAVAMMTCVVACTSGDSNAAAAGGDCNTVCDCVVGQGGDRTQCLSECGQISSRPNATADDCEKALSSRGYGACKKTCDSFDPKKTASSASAASPARGALCQKCSSCISTAGFSEGFCDVYLRNGSFDEAACNADVDTSELANPGVSAATVQSWSCDQFDDYE